MTKVANVIHVNRPLGGVQVAAGLRREQLAERAAQCLVIGGLSDDAGPHDSSVTELIGRLKSAPEPLTLSNDVTADDIVALRSNHDLAAIDVLLKARTLASATVDLLEVAADQHAKNVVELEKKLEAKTTSTIRTLQKVGFAGDPKISVEGNERRLLFQARQTEPIKNLVSQLADSRQSAQLAGQRRRAAAALAEEVDEHLQRVAADPGTRVL